MPAWDQCPLGAMGWSCSQRSVASVTSRKELLVPDCAHLEKQPATSCKVSRRAEIAGQLLPKINTAASFRQPYGSGPDSTRFRLLQKVSTRTFRIQDDYELDA